MAHLEVQPKKSSSPGWLWLLLAVIALVLLFWFFRGRNANDKVATADTLSTGNAVAATTPDWNSVDFNAAIATDAEINDPDISVRGNERYTIYTLGENILFATDQSQVQGNAEAKLKQIVAALNNRYKGASIGIYGSTDSTGEASHNKMLGAERAASVKNWMVSNGGLHADQLSVHSLGETHPVATNETSSGRQQNRNVSIVAFK